MTGSEKETRAGYGRLRPGPGKEAYDVEVSLSSQGLLLRAVGRTAETWPFALLSTKEPITEHAIDAILTTDRMPGATLFIGDPKLVRRLAHDAPHLSERALRARRRRRVLAIAAALAAGALAIWLGGLSPARGIAGVLPDTARVRLGDAVISDLTGERRQCETVAGHNALQALVGRLSKAAGDGRAFSVVVTDWSIVNAFAAPGEKIVLARGLLDKAETADELAGVLAHEMGHGIERHPETAMVRNLGISAGINLVLGGAAGSLASAGAYLAELSYTREAERAADQHALFILRQAGIATDGLAGFFRRIMAEEGENPIDSALNRIEVLRSHPMTGERIAAVAASNGYPSTPALTGEEWRALKGICSGAGVKPGAPRSPSLPPGDGHDI